MAWEEKRAWIGLVVAVGTYAAYIVIILGRSGDSDLADVPYVSTMLWTIGAGIAATIVLTIAVAVASAGRDVDKRDQRDREIERFGEYTGRWLIVIGALAALGIAMAEMDHFWIANVLYLGFNLSAILEASAKIVAYRRGFPQW